MRRVIVSYNVNGMDMVDETRVLCHFYISVCSLREEVDMLKLLSLFVILWFIYLASQMSTAIFGADDAVCSCVSFAPTMPVESASFDEIN